MEPPLHELRACPACHGLITSTDPPTYCFKCLSGDHTEDDVQQPPGWDLDRSLLTNKMETMTAIDEYETTACKRPMPPPFITTMEMKASSSKYEDKILSLSANSASGGSAVPTSVSRDILLIMKITVGLFGLQLLQPS